MKLGAWLAALSLVCAAHAAEPPVKGGGIPLFSGDPVDAFQLVGDDKALGKAEVTAVEGMPFTKALRLTTTGQGKTAWSIQVTAECPKAVSTGDVLYAEFWMRSVSGGAESAEAHTIFVFEKNSDPWTKSIETDLTAGRDWKKFTLPFAAVLPTPEKGAQFCFRMGFAAQSFELGGFQLLTYGTKAKMKDFPQMKVTYPGREKDAAWRKAALERIEKIRKGDLSVHVVSKDGRPVPGAKVRMEMVRHRFAWGSAVVGQRLSDNGPDADRYKEEVPKWFNQVVFENDLKWPFWESGLQSTDGGWNNKWVDQSFAYLERNHLSVRGHNLVWPSWRNLPGRLKAFEKDPNKLREEVRQHIFKEAGLYKGRLADWDVVNEPYTEHDLIDILGPDFLTDCFKWAREADPTAKLYLNEYGIFSGGGADKAHQDGVYGILSDLKKKGAPVDGLGIQSHLGGTLTPPERLVAILDRFAALGVDIKITELDFEIPDPQVEYEYFKDYLTAVYSHPSVKGILMWGFWDGAHWHNKAPLLSANWDLKPAGRAYSELVKGEWWSRGAGKTGADGAFTFKGTIGDYSLEASGRGGKAAAEVSILPGGNAVTITLK